MRVIDVRDMEPGVGLSCDLCIVGSGPAGVTIATELVNSRYDVMVVESGAHNREDPFAAALNEIESIGAQRVAEQRSVRNRIVGGTSHTWSGRCTTLDPIDYEARSWVPFSGWPIDGAEMAPFFRRSAEVLGLMPSNYDDALFERLQLPRRFDGRGGAEVRSVFWQLSRSAHNGDHVRFASRLVDNAGANVRVLTSATVTQIVTDAEGRLVRELELADPQGRRRTVRARMFVLCAGGLENARLLLASNRRDPRGVGNRKGLVGRFFMDHPRTTLGTFAPEAAAAIRDEFFLLRPGAGVRVQRGLSLSFDVQRSEGLLNCAAWITQDIAEDDGWRALQAFLRARGRARVAPGRLLLRNAGQIGSGLWNKYAKGKALPRRFKNLDLEVLVEQAPDPDSRLSLAERKDALGVPLSRIDWRIGELERRTVVRLGHAIHDTLAKAGLPAPRLVDWISRRRLEDAVFRDPAHPLGATRMADSPERGVVDRNSRVFGVENLYVGGSSVFSTGGHANPTMMIVALSLRLADALKARLATAE